MFLVSNIVVLLIIIISLLGYCYLTGYPLAQRFSNRAGFELSFPLGMALLAVTALLVNNALNVGMLQTVIIFLLPAGISALLKPGETLSYRKGIADRSIWLIPTVLSFIAVSGVFIKIHGTEIATSVPLFDHIKIAVINTIVREGFPIQNPFGIDPLAGHYFHYYYLFYLLAANIAILFHISGLNADIVLTFITAFISILTCFHLIGELTADSEIRRKCQYVFCLFLFSGPIAGIVNFLTHGYLFSHGMNRSYHPLESWIYQAAWVPQHVMSASFTILSLFLLGTQKFSNKGNCFLIIILIVAGFGCSVWVGGIGFAVIAALILLDGFWHSDCRKKLMLGWACIAIISFILAFPMIHDLVLAPTRNHVFPVGLALYDPSLHKHRYDLVLFFLEYMPIWLCVTTIGLYLAIIHLMIRRELFSVAFRVLLIITFGSLLTSLLIRSQIANNDLGWRAILLYIFAGNVIVSYFFVTRFSSFSRWLLIILAVLGLNSSIRFSRNLIFGGEYYSPLPSLQELQEITAITGRTDRLLLNVHQNASHELWGGNLLPPIFVNRLVCYQNVSYAAAFSPNLSAGMQHMDVIIQKFYDGQADQEELHLLQRSQCDKIVITRFDPIWNRMPYKNLRMIYSDQKRKIFVFKE